MWHILNFIWKLVETNQNLKCIQCMEETMNLSEVNVGEEYRIKDIVAEDEELKAFLFSLGCYSGEPITVIDRKRSTCVVSIKDARYCIDKALATTILV